MTRVEYPELPEYWGVFKIRKSPYINVGLIGCGRIAKLVHINILNKSPQLRLVAIAESNKDNREAASKLVPEAVTFSDYLDLLSTSSTDAVIICLPNSEHAKATRAALDHGKHVYLEKPLARNTQEAKGIINVWEKSNLKGMIGFNLRFNPLYQTLKEQIHSGVIGNVSSVRTVFSSSGGSDSPAWKQKRITGGGALLDLASHHIDLIRYMFESNIRETFAHVRSHKSEDDHATLHLTMADGLEIQSFFSLDSVEEDKIEVYGTKGKLTADRYFSVNVELTYNNFTNDSRLRLIQRGINHLLRSPNLLQRFLAPSREPSYEKAISHFASAVLNNHPVNPDFTDGYRCLSIIEAAEESARTGRSISLTSGDKQCFEEIAST